MSAESMPARSINWEDPPARSVLRWQVPVDDQTHNVGSGPVRLVAARKHGIVEVWTEEETVPAQRFRRVQVYGTGHELPPSAEWLGSCIPLRDGPSMVWHLYEQLW